MTEANRGSSPSVERAVARRDFLKTAGWATAAISAAGIGGFGLAATRVSAQDQPYTTYQGIGDVAIFQFAYLLELLEGTFYDQGVNAGIFDDYTVTQIAAIRDHEMQHADAIAAVLGAETPAAPQFTYPDGVFADPVAFLELAATFEPVGIGAYQGAAPALESKDLLASAISIHNSECQHRCAIDVLRGIDPPNNVAFEEALPLPAVQEAVAPFGITG
jgi:hypothetical protein